ncbi:MADS-box transcription factor 1 [Triticum urartu]|uniref:MADS-box transcription factor 1 n=1 Tax=Triticum urartu TaxID=4572 RepID=M8AVY9_TRIUA|nr:MADS-box transcription factor 1 [Triticum urartu]
MASSTATEMTILAACTHRKLREKSAGLQDGAGRFRQQGVNGNDCGGGGEGRINYQEYLKLKTRLEYLQSSQRNILGEDLGPLTMRELEQIENQIDISLKHIRTRKNKVLLDELYDLKSKEQELLDQNKDLRKKLHDISCAENALHMSWQDGGHGSSSGHAIKTTYPGLLQRPEHDSSMQIGYIFLHGHRFNPPNLC